MIKNISITILCKLIYLYQLVLSPLIQPCCRFRPTCSEYAIDALKTHGIIKGLALASKRLISCHPWSKKHGLDPVPNITTE